MAIDRRTFLQVSTAALAVAHDAARAAFANVDLVTPPSPVLKLKSDPHRASIAFLSWDTEGGDRAERNLLRAGSGVTLRLKTGDSWREAVDLPTRRHKLIGNGSRYRFSVSPQEELIWNIKPAPGRLTLSIAAKLVGKSDIDTLELVFPFDPRVTPVTAIPADWREDGSLQLPAIISAPDFGQMILTCEPATDVEVRLEGSRANHTVDLILRFPPPGAQGNLTLTLKPLKLAPPQGLRNDTILWPMARRGWFNLWQPSSQWGEQNRPFSAPAGILANNVISDPASCSLWFYADPILWTPELAPGISAARLVRRSVDWWLDKRTRASGEVIGYWDYGNFLDANAGVLISAWDYVEATGDLAWLRNRIERLEFVSDFLARRDVDGDGMVEATQSGNRGTLIQPARSCCYVDAVNCGHKDGYSNAVIYRSWRCLADLEAKLGRSDQKAHYSTLANRLKAVYARILFNPDTGWLAWWKSADGELHDYATPLMNSMAIEYGLVDTVQGGKILSRLRAKMHSAGFTRFDLGVPLTLVPIHRSDYLLPHAFGLPQREDGTDTFQHYQNGAANALVGAHFIAAHYVAGEIQEAGLLLLAMLERQAEGKFHNGVIDKAHFGGEWTTWDGQPCGYEGYLADVYYFLLAIVLREPELRARMLRPLT
jgi:hypothetical protein